MARDAPAGRRHRVLPSRARGSSPTAIPRANAARSKGIAGPSAGRWPWASHSTHGAMRVPLAGLNPTGPRCFPAPRDLARQWLSRCRDSSLARGRPNAARRSTSSSRPLKLQAAGALCRRSIPRRDLHLQLLRHCQCRRSSGAPRRSTGTPRVHQLSSCGAVCHARRSHDRCHVP